MLEYQKCDLIFAPSLSFLDDAFRKNLESALRFGNPLLVQVGLLELISLVLLISLYLRM